MHRGAIAQYFKPNWPLALIHQPRAAIKIISTRIGALQHIAAYCIDLGFGAARGAEMLSLMLACGMFSRLVSGVICDRIGGVRTLLLGSALQGVGADAVSAV